MSKNEETLQMQKKLKDKLPKQWVEIVASRCERKKRRIYQVFNDWDINSPIFKEIINLAEEHQEDLKRLQNLTSNEN